MREWIITSSVLILIVVCLRTLLKGKINLKLQNALWLLVLVRLLVPVNSLSSSMSVLNAVPKTPRTSVTESAARTAGAKNFAAGNPPVVSAEAKSTVKVPTVSSAQTASPTKTAPVRASAPVILRGIWLSGVAVLALMLLLSNLRFSLRLRRTRKPFAADGATTLPIYLVRSLPSPCLFGLLHPAIYLSTETAGGSGMLRHILIHEDTHFRRGDNWWNLLRCGALVLHWYNPLVWLAAVLSRRDTELACDEATVKRLGEAERAGYGRTLISMASRKGSPADLLCCATTMTSGKRGLRERITLLAKGPKTAAAAAVCLLLAVCVATGCTFTGAKSSAKASAKGSASRSAASSVGQKSKPYQPSEPMKVYKCGDIQIGIPEKYLSQLTIDTTVKKDDTGTLLLNVSETASLKAAEADGYKGDSGFGNLFSIVRMTRAQYEQTLGLDFSGYQDVAYSGSYSGHHYTFSGGKYYYLCLTPTDVQYYRRNGVIDMNSSDWKNWETLCGLAGIVKKDILGRNDLTPFSSADVLSNQVYTYDSKHAFVRYYLYYTRDGSRAEYDTLILSQPVRQGKGGIWCVERISDEYGQVSLNFPGKKKTAASYYEALQKECDGGGHPELLIPLTAAKQYVKTCGYYNDTPVDGCFRQVKKLDTDYSKRNTEAASLVAGLIYPSSGHPVDENKLLTCFGRFTADNWGVLGRRFYRSDWWTPLCAALERASVGSDQAFRDENILHLYLAYPKDTGPIAKGLTAILQKQLRADRQAFLKTLDGFSETEQAKVQSLLGLKTA